MDGMSSVAPDNAEATEAWSGPLFEIFLKYRDLTTGGLRRPRRGGDAVEPAAAGRAGD